MTSHADNGMPTLGLDLGGQRTVLLELAIPRRSWWSPLMSAVGAEAPPRIVCTLSSIDMYPAWMGGCLQ